MQPRPDETWHRLREWTYGQAPSERLAGQVLLAEDYAELDPSHPLGGPDGAKDAMCTKAGRTLVMAVYFPRGQQSFGTIKAKFSADLGGVEKNGADGIVFVTNQELTLSERKSLAVEAGETHLELYHLERVTAVLDQPEMAPVRSQFLGIGSDKSTGDQLSEMQRQLVGAQTGGDSFCYWMLYDFDLAASLARQFCLIRRGEFPLYDVRFRIREMMTGTDVCREKWGELNSPADFSIVKWPLREDLYYRVFFHARNGSWNQDLILRRSVEAGCWLAATHVRGKSEIRFEHLDNEFEPHFGPPKWKQ